MTQSTRRLCQGWVAARPSWGAVAPRGRGVTAAVVSRRLLCPMVATALPSLPPANVRLSGSQARAATAVLERCEERIESDLRVIRAGVDEGLRMGRERGIPVPPRDLADKVTRVVRNSGGRLARRALTAEVEAYVGSRAPLNRVLSRDRFAAFEPIFAQRWARDGAANLEAFPASRYGLGNDEPPPFVVGSRESTWLGLSRSVYSRYRLAARDPLVEGDAESIALAEIGRACGPLGLNTRPALVALSSVSVGLLYGPVGFDWRPPHDTDFDASWRGEGAPLEPCPPRSEDPFLPRGKWVHAELAAFVQASMAAFVMGTRQGAMLRHAGLVERAHQHVMRRAWMMCFESERRGQVIDGRRAARIVSYAIFKGIPAGEAHHLRQLLLGVGDTRPPASEDVAALDPDVLSHVLEWLAGHPELAVSLLSEGSVDAAQEYAEAAAQLGMPPLERLLTEFGRV